MNICAVGFKGWAEIRAYKTVPKPYVDEVSKVLKEKHIIWGRDVYGSRSMSETKEVEVPYNFRTIRYPGGKVLYTLSMKKLMSLGINVPQQSCIVLTNNQIKSLIAKDFGKLTKYVKGEV